MQIPPSVRTTVVEDDGSTWRPTDFDSLLLELGHIRDRHRERDHYLLYRGQADSRWLLDSTFARHAKARLGLHENFPPEIMETVEMQRLLLGRFLVKFGVLTRPSGDLLRFSAEHGLDPWFEWMRRIQQYPDEDKGPDKGTFLLDWTQDWRVSLFFAACRRPETEHAAVFVADMSDAGKILHRNLTVGSILDMLRAAAGKNEAPGCPLIFCPRRQIACNRAGNQDAIYVAHMDLRVDLARQWAAIDAERCGHTRILLKLVLTPACCRGAERWLIEQGLTARFIFPDELDAALPTIP